jgi:hypothetical protein
MKKFSNSKEMLEHLRKTKKNEIIILNENITKPMERIYNLNNKSIYFTLKYIIDKTSCRECLLCRTNLIKDLGDNSFHVPLCQRHRLELLDEQAKEFRQSKKYKVFRRRFGRK